MNMSADGGVCNIDVKQPRYNASRTSVDSVLFDGTNVVGIVATEPNRSGLASVVVSGVVQLCVAEGPDKSRQRLYYNAATKQCTFDSAHVMVGDVIRIVRAPAHRGQYCVTTRLSAVPTP